MSDFDSDDLRDALDDAPDVPDVSDDAMIGRDDPDPVPARQPTERDDTDSEPASDGDEPGDDAPTPARRDRDDESLREILDDIRRLDDSEPRPSELRDDAGDATISTATVAAVVIGVGAVGLAVSLGVVPA
jgi:hypothetical protein